MPALNFQKQFAPKVESGEKRQTIRAKRKRPFKLHDNLYHYTGMRTKYCRKLGESECSKVFDVIISENGTMKISDKYLNKFERNEIAKKDGFDCWNDMWLWFQKTHGFPFYGQLVMWDEIS